LTKERLKLLRQILKEVMAQRKYPISPLLRVRRLKPIHLPMAPPDPMEVLKPVHYEEITFEFAPLTSPVSGKVVAYEVWAEGAMIKHVQA
jgi:hypothetical protein